MNLQEEQELRAVGERCAAAEQNRWQPACVAHAFTGPTPGELALTLQGWLELDARRSPLLRGELPPTLAALEEALPAFGLARPTDFAAVEEAELALAMLEAVQSAFATALRMELPGRPAPAENDGFGDWIVIFAFLVTACGLAPEAALALRVDRALALIAAHRHNQGWRVTGTPYALRELPAAEEVRHD